MEIIVTKNMQAAIKETMDAEMNIYYLLQKGGLTSKEREEITEEYLKRIFEALEVREQNQNIGNQLMQEILDEKYTFEDLNKG